MLTSSSVTVVSSSIWTTPLLSWPLAICTFKVYCSTYLAYIVVSPVIYVFSKSNGVVRVASLYHPAKAYPLLIGSVGLLTLEPAGTFTIYIDELLIFPPFRLNVTS